MNSLPLCQSYPDLAVKVAALSHPVRLTILSQIAGEGACCCKQVVDKLDLAQSTVSQHLKVLVDSGLVRYEPQNRQSRYTVVTGEVTALAAALSSYLGDCAVRAQRTEERA